MFYVLVMFVRNHLVTFLFLYFFAFSIFFFLCFIWTRICFSFICTSFFLLCQCVYMCLLEDFIRGLGNTVTIVKGDLDTGGGKNFQSIHHNSQYFFCFPCLSFFIIIHWYQFFLFV